VRLPLFIAKRYLFARKSHNVINIISAISAIGMAIGTAALVLILSVYNGFDSLIKSSLSDIDPELKVVPVEGKVFDPLEVKSKLLDIQGISSVSEVLEDDIFMSFEGRQSVAKAVGVDSVFEAGTGMESHILNGKWSRFIGDVPMASIGMELAVKLGVNPHFVAPIELYYPDRHGKLSPSNPAASLNKSRVYPGSIFSINGDMDAQNIFVPIETLREVLGYENEVSGLEIRVDSTLSSRKLKGLTKTIKTSLGPDYKVLERFQQHPSLYKLMKYEKLAIYMILLFVVIIIAFNIFGSLSMLIIEKEDDIATLKAMGANDRLIKRIFILEGWMISLLGMIVGLVIGVLLALAQQKFGLVKMPGSFIVSAYPVVVQWSDVLLTALGVALIGLLVAIAPVLRRKQS